MGFSGGGTVNIIDRRKNILKHPTKKAPKRNISDIKGIVVHHSLTTGGSADAFARYHINTNGWSVMGYTYVINKNGSIEWCADWNVVTPHVGDYNKNHLGICLVGDFRIEKPTKAQMKSLYELITYIRNNISIPIIKILGHQELPSYSWKQCPALNMDQLRGQIQYKTYGDVQNNYNNDLKVLIVKPDSKDNKLTDMEQEVGNMKMSQFISDSDMVRLETVYRHARYDGFLSDMSWEKKCQTKELTVGEAVYLTTLIDHRRHAKTKEESSK